jgi:hypothetical protein
MSWGNGLKSEARQVFFPYNIHRVDAGLYVVLNRNYKPLGMGTDEFVNYADYAVPLRITAAQAAKMSWNGATDVASIYLYDDGCIPTRSAAHMRAYLARLEVFSRLKIKRGQPQFFGSTRAASVLPSRPQA